MDKLDAAQRLGVAEYTIATHVFDAERDGWVVTVRDMANHTETERFVPADQVAHIYPRPAIETTAEEEESHGEALAEMAFDGEELARVVNLTIAEITEWVGTNDVRALAVLIAEEQRDKPRKTLVEALQAVLAAAEKAAAGQ